MLEFIVELLFDILFEGTVYIYESKKVIPTPIRIFAGIIIALLYIFVSGLSIFAAIASFMDNQIVPALLFLGLGLFFLIGGFHEMKKGWRKRRA